MKTRIATAPGFVADRFWRYTHSTGFRARERFMRRAVAAEFAPRLAAARGMHARTRVRVAELLAWWDVRRALYPSPRSCYFVP